MLSTEHVNLADIDTNEGTLSNATEFIDTILSNDEMKSFIDGVTNKNSMTHQYDFDNPDLLEYKFNNRSIHIGWFYFM